MNASPVRFYEFGPFRIDTIKRLLLRDGEPITLKAKCFETLLILVEAGGQVLEKDDLMRRIWPDTIVEESNLTVYISALRRALGENHRDHRYIVTVPGRGYSFVAEVKEVREESAELVLPKQSSLSLIAEEEKEARLPERASRSFQPLSRLSAIPSLSRQRPGIVAVAALSSFATIIIAAIVLLYFSSSKSDKAIHSLAILPFTIDGNIPGIEYLAEGIANDIANRLSRLPELTVISSNAVARYKAHGAAPDAQAVGREFKTEAVVVGNLAQQGDHIHIKVEIIDARNNAHLWGKLYDRKLTDIFEALEEIVREISSVLRPGG